ncbi:FAD-dependent monooxygenase [Actinokineospora soli]|uniref:FAD-dependent monooxygenase n=1 Tax=Actinokineospora soli TaxID=1048753 RepID=A0ABW2TNM8_9PSEU
MKAVVAGAGIGGLTAAIALRARGIDVEVLEAAPAPRAEGGGLGLASNATKVLAALGLDLPKAGIGQVCTGFSLRTARGADLRELPIRAIAEELGSPVVNVRRGDLLTFLRDSLADTPVHYGARVDRYDHDTTAVRVTLADGTVHTGDVLVGADGIRSAVRARLTGPEPVLDHGYTCWIATTPFTHPRLPEGGAAHYWGRGQRFGLIDVGGGRAYWWGTRNTPRRAPHRWTGGKPDILRCYDGWADEVRAVIEATPETDILAVPAQDRAFRDTWGEGPVTLLGDAAHPMLTSLSQGAGTGSRTATRSPTTSPPDPTR